jgi:tartrate-resistant acid phosphatase type 5
MPELPFVVNSIITGSERPQEPPGFFMRFLFGGSSSERWRTQFEEMYPANVFPGKFDAVLGNHDYEHRPGDKVAAQLEYAKKPGTRWALPSKWYSFAVPEARPVIRFISLDSNYPERRFFRTTPTLTTGEVAAQNAWLQQQLAAPSPASFTIVIAHHPHLRERRSRGHPLH